ncbi:thermonuclease family protein [Metabacillus fastidiosus]|uniref:Thermonuclease family protein n=1 Tax=Metabacillus fastidiosus TaxID=1458 RepID=A0ABU6NWE9_9BACI|nr:thermonuclease family protein [Metabacillus fastidiosus]MED4401371.1 thermonuclease family protein [Metabacillus fastidiosus]MED4463008.1 thermonuclease family protein [Metabacillus fastidiosus]
MKIIKWILIILAFLIILSSLIITPLAWIGLLIFGFGVYQSVQKDKGKGKFSKPGLIVALGFVFSFIMAMVFVEPVSETSTKLQEEKTNNETIEKELAGQQEKEKLEQEKKEKELAEQKAAAELKAKQEAEAKAKAENEAKKQQEELATNLGLETVTISRVVDGDTVELSDRRKIRLVGVNTPESTTRTEEYGKEASNYTTDKLEGKQVWIQKDVSDTDRYNRDLRIIWLAIPSDDMNEDEIRSKMFNADLVINGYAEPSTYPPDVKYSEYFVKFAREARENNTGLWAFGENGTTKGDLDTKETKSPNTNPKPAQPAEEPKNQATSNAGCNIKGNQSGIYHVPGGAYYEVTKAEEMFCSPEEAEAAGYRASKR